MRISYVLRLRVFSLHSGKFVNMPRKAESCVLQSIQDPTRKLNLPHNTKIYVGRDEFTEIADLKLSRKQLAVTADYNNYTVNTEVMGLNFSGCNGYAIRKGGTYNLKHGDHLELRIGDYQFCILFHPPPDGYANEDNDIVEAPAKIAKPTYSLFNFNSKINNSPSTANNTINDNDGGSWEHIDSGDLLIYSDTNVKPSTKIAAFDLDGTLIKTKSGSRFAKNAEDCQLNFPSVPKKLSSLITDGFKIVIFTNQGGLKSNNTKIEEFKFRIKYVLEKIKVPVQLFAATNKNIYRKPALGMWNSLFNEKNSDVKVDINNSFYVGDAAGRQKDWAPYKPKDHSTADRLFALNIGLRFYTPEEYFLSSPSVPYKMPNFNPQHVARDENPIVLEGHCEVIIMVGSPGSGKSHYCKEHLVQNDFVHINRDTLRSWQACVKLMEKSLQQKRSVVIDNTNPDKATRKRYIDIAKKYNVPCRCFLMNTSPEHCKHNNRFREITDKTHVPVTDIILNIFKKNFEKPSLEEGFNEIVTVDCIPKFDNADNEKLYKMFLLES